MSRECWPRQPAERHFAPNPLRTAGMARRRLL